MQYIVLRYSKMKTYTIVVRMNGDSVEDILDFINNEFTRADVECLYEDGRNCRLQVEVDDDFDYGYLEDCLDGSGYKCEFISLEKD